MPYTLFQGGRRRRRRRAPAVLALLVVLAAAAAASCSWSPSAGTATSGRASAAPRGAQAAGGARACEPLAGGGTAPSPLAVRLEQGGDPVRARFKQMPRSGLLFDIDTGRVLWRHQPTRVLPIASLTKMMTALWSPTGSGRGARVPITREALRYQGSGVGLLPRGKRIRTETMLYGLMLPSGNDAAIALAQRAAGTRAEVRRRDERARASGWACVCSRFSSPHGFEDQGNHSCAGDLAAVARAVLRVPRLAEIVRSREAALPFPIKGGKLYLYNNNPLLRQGYRGITGMKTGYTDAAGRCFVATARRGGVRLGVVLLHSPDPGGQAQAACWTAASRSSAASARARGRVESSRSSWMLRVPRAEHAEAHAARARPPRPPRAAARGARARRRRASPRGGRENSTPRRSSTSRTGAQPATTVPSGSSRIGSAPPGRTRPRSRPRSPRACPRA